MKYFQCSVRHRNTFYSWNHYDLESNNEDEIIEELKERGYDVLEVWDIEAQC